MEMSKETHYIPVWINVNGDIGRHFPKATPEDCEALFTNRVEAGLDDKEYIIEQVTTEQFYAQTRPVR